MDRLPSPDEYVTHQGKVFRPDGLDLELTLTAVEMGAHDETRRQLNLPPAFIVIFHGPAAPVMQEGFHSLVSDDGARFEAYVMPIHTPWRDRQNYQIVYN